MIRTEFRKVEGKKTWRKFKDGSWHFYFLTSTDFYELGEAKEIGQDKFAIVLYSLDKSNFEDVEMFNKFHTMSEAKIYLSECFERIMRVDPRDHSMFLLFSLLSWERVI